MTELLIFGVAGSVWVKTIVDLIKKAGLPDSLAIPAALIVGVALAVCSQVALTDPVFALWFQRVVEGITAALVAMNLYDVTHSLDKLAKAS
jgi:hypothetical protein